MDKRIFSYDGRAWDDPDPTLTPEEVKQQMSSFFPELSSATITEHKKDDGTIIYEMTRKTGTKGNKTPWKMPDWMEKYRSYFRDTGGNSIEELMNDTSTIEINAPLAILACSAHAQVMFLAALKLNHFLAQDP